MVNGVEAPHRRHHVTGEMNPVFGKVRDQDREEKLHQPGQAADRVGHGRNVQGGRELGGGQQDQEGRDLNRQMGGQEVPDVR